MASDRRIIPRPKAQKLTPDQRAEIRRRRYEPQKRLAHEFGVCISTISITQARPNAGCKLSPEQIADIKRRAAAGLETLRAIGDTHAVSVQMVWNIKHGHVRYAR